MTQIVVTLEDGYNVSMVRDAIEMIKGVKNALVKKHSHAVDSIVSQRLKTFDKLAGAISLSDIDMSDDRTKYLLSK